MIVAKLPRESDWLRVDRITGSSFDGSPWLVAPGLGFDVHRLVVYADSEQDALEIAEETWPDFLFEPYDPDFHDWVDEDDLAPHPEGKGYDGLAVREEDIRILAPVQLDRFARRLSHDEALQLPGVPDAVLRSGQPINVR